MATIQLKAGMVWRGVYSASEPYNKLDVVCNTAKTQIAVCKQRCSGIPLTNLNYWECSLDINDIIEDARDTAQHPTYVGDDNYVYAWNKSTHTYNKTSVYVKGEGFSISKIFASVAAMEAYTGTDLKEGDFVLIQSNTEDPDNAKLYTYSGTQGVYNFLVDMSGAIGFTGKTPQFFIGTVTTVENNVPASASLTPDGTDSDGNPKYKLSLSIPKGTPSNIEVVNDHSGDGIDNTKQYVAGAAAEKETHDSIMIIPSEYNDTAAKLKVGENIVRGSWSLAIGEHNNIGSSSYDSFVCGRYNLAGAPKVLVSGNVNWAGGSNSIVFGGFNLTRRGMGYAEGCGNDCNGQSAHMEGHSAFVITLTGAAGATTYSVDKDLPEFFIGLYVFYCRTPEATEGFAFTRATITAIDNENHTITLSNTLDSANAIPCEHDIIRLLASTTQLKASHVEGCYNFNVLNDTLTENPLIGTVFEDEYIAEKEDRLQGGHVEGFGNVIAGKYAHAEGVFNLVIGQYAHAEGRKNKVLNQQAHAEGGLNVVDSNGAHVEGVKNFAHGAQSHAEGYVTKTKASRAHSEGYGTIAGENNGYANHAEGYVTVASGNCGCHSEGFATAVIGGVGAHSEGYGGYIVHLTGAENVTTYSVDKAPLDIWINSYVLSNNMVENSTRKIIAIDKVNNTITVDESFGNEVTPDKIYKVISQLSLGSATHVEGFINIAKANASHAEGYNNYSYGFCSHAEGKRTVSAGKASHTEGENGRAYGDFSHTEGYGNTAFGKASHAGGDGSLIVELTGAAKATTYNVNITPEAEWVGRLIKNTVDDDIVNYILITEIDSTNNTITVNETLDGTNALSSSQYCIALGGAIADYSFAHGKGVQCGTEAGAVFGKFNVPRSNALFAVGKGTSFTNQSDAFYIDVDGNVYIAGNIVSTQISQLTNKITQLENRIAALEGNS